MLGLAGSVWWPWISVALLSWNGRDWAGHGWNGGSWWPWMLIPLLFWGGFITLIAWAVIRLFPRRRADERLPAPRDRAEEILRERFARGEIGAEEYQRSLEILREGTGRATRKNT